MGVADSADGDDVTIVCTTKELFTDKWHYTIIDAFGHRDFIKNVSEADRLRLQ